MESNSNPEQRSYKEQRIREITLMYYSRSDVRKAIFEFSKNRECIPIYFEQFGKRPDNFQYEGDILEQVKKGATSFHCSEELWKDPLEISTESSKDEFNEYRIGWDLLLDIDSPYFEYSKIYGELLIETLKFHGIENIGVKFSGSKGLHIIIPWKAFPKEIYRQKTKDMFPEWPRIICEYLSELIQPRLEDEILKDINLKDIAKRTGKKEEELLVTECKLCKRPAAKKEFVRWICPNCKNELLMIRKNKRIPRCPNENCRKIMDEESAKEIYVCDYCNTNSYKNPEYFAKERYKTEEHIEADLILVAPRHLFRMPYSLHEKTALASIVIDKNKIKDFQLTDARPLKVQIKNFYPDAKDGEARHLLLQALDWKEQKEKEENQMQEKKSKDPTYSITKQKGFQKLTIQNPSPEIFPPCIKLLLNGVKQDGRKRALFILINFFGSLGTSDQEIEKKLSDWNQKNYLPLKKGYIQSQLSWYRKNKALMPPNCSRSNYRELNVCKPDSLCRAIKNPVNYAVKKYFMLGKK
jgi:hypothetical protein